MFLDTSWYLLDSLIAVRSWTSHSVVSEITYAFETLGGRADLRCSELRCCGVSHLSTTVVVAAPLPGQLPAAVPGKAAGGGARRWVPGSSLGTCLGSCLCLQPGRALALGVIQEAEEDLRQSASVIGLIQRCLPIKSTHKLLKKQPPCQTQRTRVSPCLSVTHWHHVMPGAGPRPPSHPTSERLTFL